MAYLKAQRDDRRNEGAYGLYTYLIDQFEQVPACLDCSEDVIGDAGRLRQGKNPVIDRRGSALLFTWFSLLISVP